uniref:Centrosome and spindle pole-associated protein 1 n=1 Tax=Magallana gigas TaxID=29159 RepID=A0A8W8KKM9_MAGGI
MCAAMVDRNPEYPDYGRPMYDSNPQNDYGRPAYESYQQPGDYRRGQEYGQERYNPTSQYPGSSDPPVPDDLQITSGLVSLSDEKAKERRHLIQMEMRKEYEDHMRRKEEQANRHRDEMVRQQHASPPHPANQTEMYDHNQMSQQLREERRKEYNDYLRVTSPPHQANIGHDDYGAFRRQTEHEVRNKEYNDFLAKKQHLEDEKKQKLADQRRQAPAPIVKGDYYDSEQYDRRRQALNDLQHREYQNYLKNKGFNQHQPPETNRRPELGLKSEFQDQEPAGRQSQRNAPVGSLIAGDRVDYPSSANERFNRERRKDYNDYIKKQEADRFRKQENTRPDNRIGFMTHLGRPVEEMREKLAKERHEEYNKYLKDKYISQPHQRPLERPKWVDSKLMEDNWQKEAAGSRSRPTSDKPIHTPTYEEMLDKKRREEASYRRFDDPEYSRSGADRGYDAQYRRYDQ